MFIQNSFWSRCWTFREARYYIARSNRVERFALLHEFQAKDCAFVTMTLVMLVSALVNAGSLMPAITAAAATAAVVYAATYQLYRRYSKYRAQLLSSERVVTLDHDGKSSDGRWEYLTMVVSRYELAFLFDTREGNGLLDTFLETVPVEASWHPEARETLYDHVGSVIMHMRQLPSPTQ